jgi:hypothetical protein
MCPDFEALLDYLEGAPMEAEARRSIEEHVAAGCMRCQGVMEAARHLTGLLGDAGKLLERPSEEAEQRVLAMGTAVLEERRLREGLPVHVGELVRQNPYQVAAGFRGGEPGRGVEEFVHSNQPVGVRLQITPEPAGTRKLRGNVYPLQGPPEEPREIVLRDDEGNERPAEHLPRGGFTLGGLESGSYSLVLRFQGYSLVFPVLEAAGDSPENL